LVSRTFTAQANAMVPRVLMADSSGWIGIGGTGEDGCGGQDSETYG
jgi:hypothetical protein